MFKFLGSTDQTGPGSELLFVEKYGETLYRESGWTAGAYTRSHFSST